MKEILEKLVSKKTEFNIAEEKFNSSTDAQEVRSLGDALATLKADIAALEAELEAAQNKEEPKEEKPADESAENKSDKAEDAPADEEKPADKAEDADKTDDAPAEEPVEDKKEERSGFNPLNSLNLNKVNIGGNKKMDNILETMEYRSAFMNYVQKGELTEGLQFRSRNNEIIQYRADTPLTSADLGVMLPQTVVQEIIKGLEGKYGQLYSKVRHLNIKGGVKFPKGDFGVTFKRIAETGAPSDRQKGGSITGYIEFSYKMGEIRVAQTLLESILSVEAFEKEFAKVIVEAYLKGIDNEILNGIDSANQCEGILPNEAKIPAGNIIEFTEAEMKDWTKIQKKLFAKIPLSMRAEKPEFVMTVNTYEGNLKVLADDNNNPVAKEVFNIADGVETATFNNREVVFVEEGLGIKNFDEAATGEVFAIYWVPSRAYAINTNLDFAVKRYFDEEKLQWINRAVIINDGKILDSNYIYLLKKKVSA